MTTSTPWSASPRIWRIRTEFARKTVEERPTTDARPEERTGRPIGAAASTHRWFARLAFELRKDFLGNIGETPYGRTQLTSLKVASPVVDDLPPVLSMAR